MKRYWLVAFFQIISFVWLNAQVADKVAVINDLTTDPAPSSFSREVRFHFKWNASIGVPAYGDPGPGTYSGLMTIAPWSDGTAAKHHQINFNEEGLFWRKGAFGGAWEPWKKIIVAEADGNIALGQGGSGIYWDWPSRIIEQYSPDGGTSQVIRFRNSMSSESGNTNGGFDFAWHDGLSVMRIINGRVGIGTIDPDTKLAVKGTIHSEEVKVDLNVPAPDYVFEKDYNLMPLDDLEDYIVKNKHLPEIPAADEMEANGLNLKEMNLLLLKKIEELTLHSIRQEKALNEYREKLEALTQRILSLEKNQMN